MWTIIFSITILWLTRTALSQEIIICQSDSQLNGYCEQADSCPAIFGALMSPGTCQNDTLCCAYSPVIPASTSQVNYGLCGYKGDEIRPLTVPEFSDRILGGTDQITPNEFCWQVNLFTSLGNTYVGGGALITPRSILTTANVAKRMQEQGNYAIVGDISKKASSTNPCTQVVEVADVKMDPNYQGASTFFRSNVAIVNLKTPVVLNGICVCLICLPAATDIFETQMCSISGLGATSHAEASSGNAPYTDNFKKVELMILYNPMCDFLYKHKNIIFTMDSTHLCAGGQPNKDVCKGDGGSALACKNKEGRWVAAGLASAGYECGHAGVPGLYTRVSSVLSFINSNKIN